MNISIILTSTVIVQPNKTYVVQKNKNDRVNSYIKSIKMWLDNTNFKITLVDNSGYSFQEELSEYVDKYKDRFEIISFVEEDIVEAKYLKNCVDKGPCEIFSINYAYYHSKFIRYSDYVIKVTARFFIPLFEQYLRDVNIMNYDVIVQNDRNRCEMVGCKTFYFHKLFNNYMINDQYKFDGYAEGIYYFRTSTFFNNIHISKVFDIEMTFRGGCSIPYTTI